MVRRAITFEATPSCVRQAALSSNFQKLLSDSSFFVSLSARMERLCSQWAEFHEILYLSIFRKYFVKIKFFLKNETRIKGTLRERLCNLRLFVHFFSKSEIFWTFYQKEHNQYVHLSIQNTSYTLHGKNHIDFLPFI
jgi:hypothetical protein